ncbi:MAG: PilZ domain-containing protein [Desulfobacteraceae bacterium]|nr:PilZ domain-containing protein [Desulfobacteraceae bacterium]
MTQKIYITQQNTATFLCPGCQRSTTADVTKYANTDKKVVVSVKCACGHAFRVQLEKRRKYRKGTDLAGTYTLFLSDKNVDKGSMKVVDISATGLKLVLNVDRKMAVGDKMDVQFRLNDKKRTLIEKRVEVRNIIKNKIGVSFSANDVADPAIGFYLLS